MRYGELIQGFWLCLLGCFKRRILSEKIAKHQGVLISKPFQYLWIVALEYIGDAIAQTHTIIDKLAPPLHEVL